MAVKIEVGKTYELNNGDVHECVRMSGGDPTAVDEYGFGPFVINGVLYHQDGRVADCGLNHDLSVKREVITIEHGKYYRTRDGRKVGPMEEEQDGDFMAEHPDKGGYFTASWNPNGKRWMKEPNLDLIAEWGEETRDPELTSPYGDGNHPLPPMAGTLAELQVKPGDVVECVELSTQVNDHYLTVGKHYEINADLKFIDDEGDLCSGHSNKFRIISRASDTPKTWGEMTDADKGDSATMEAIEYIDEVFDSNLAQRVRDELGIKPEPKQKTVTLYHGPDDTAAFTGYKRAKDDVVITYTRTDGKPDLDSIKMEALG